MNNALIEHCVILLIHNCENAINHIFLLYKTVTYMIIIIITSIIFMIIIHQ